MSQKKKSCLVKQKKENKTKQLSHPQPKKKKKKKGGNVPNTKNKQGINK